MPRAKTRVASRARRKKILDAAKGYFGRRKSTVRVAKEQVEHSWRYAYDHRRLRKAEFRSLWTGRINAASRPLGLTYSALVSACKKANIELGRRMLAELALNEPAAFKAVVEKAKSAVA